MNAEEAEEYTRAAEQTLSGGWRFTLLGKQLGVPQALGISLEDWQQRLGGYVKLSLPERREAVAELTDEGLSREEIAEVLGVGTATVARDRAAVSNDTETADPPPRNDQFSVSDDTETDVPEPTEAGQQFLDDYINKDDDLKRREQNKKLHADLDKAWKFQQWDAAFAAAVMEDDDITNVKNLIINLQSWVDQLVKERRQKLAVVKEMHR